MRYKKFLMLLMILLVGFVAVTPVVYSDIWDPWHRKDEFRDMFRDLSDDYSTYASYEVAGKTYEGQDIWMFKFGNPNGGGVFWDAQLHGNEDYGSEILFLIAEWLFESGDPKAQRILQRNYVMFIPVVNVDSYGRYNNNHEVSKNGVNLNRNFETGWQEASPTSDDYGGEEPASEPETKTVRSVFQTYKPSFYVNLHQGAGPFFNYYRGGDVNIANQVISRATELANEMGVSMYRTGGMGSRGFAIGDGASFGASSWLAEVDEGWEHTEEKWQELVNDWYPKCLAFFIAMCESCESDVPPPTPPAYLTITSTAGGTTDPLLGTYDYTADSSLNVTAIPNSGYSFDYWLLDGEERTENPINVIMDINHTLEAVFVEDVPPPTPPTAYLTITSTAGGTTDPLLGTYDYTADSSLNVTAIPNSGYSFDYWLLDGEERTENPINVIMDINHTLEAVFVDDVPPGIDVPIQEPSENITPYQNVTVAVNVTDLGTGIYNVTLWYSINNGTTWTPLNMTEKSTNTYQATISGYKNCTGITYKITAYDKAGNPATNNNWYNYKYHVIQEFPSFLILLLFIIATILAVIVYIRKSKSIRVIGVTLPMLKIIEVIKGKQNKLLMKQLKWIESIEIPL